MVTYIAEDFEGGPPTEVRIPYTELDPAMLRILAEDGDPQAAAMLQERRFSEDQPRVPAGEPGGGQWVGEGGNAATAAAAAVGMGRTPRFAGVRNAEVYARKRFGYADFSGLKDSDLPTLQTVIDQIDRLADKYPQTAPSRPDWVTPSSPSWGFGGVGTYDSPECPQKVRDLGQDAWAVTNNGGGFDPTSIGHQPGNPENVEGYKATQGPYIWFRPDGFSDIKDSMLGQIGFMLSRNTEEAAIHEFGHVVAATTEDSVGAFGRALYDVYNPAENPRTSIGRDVSVYAADRSHEEGFAEIFLIANTKDGMSRLPSDAARARVARVIRLTNKYVGEHYRSKGRKVF